MGWSATTGITRGDRGDGRDRARARRAGRVLVVFRPLRYSRTRHLARELAAALAAADVVAVADVSGASEPRPDGVSGKLVVDALAELRPGCRSPGRPSSPMPRDSRPDAPVPATSSSPRERRRRVSGQARPGVPRMILGRPWRDDLSSPGGAYAPYPRFEGSGNRHACGTKVCRKRDDESTAGRSAIEESVPLARLTTVGIGGPARRSRSRRRSPSWSAWSLGGRARLADRSDRARVEPARGGRRRRRARRPARGRARCGRDRWRAARRRRRCGERGLPAPCGGGSRRLRVRVRDPGHGRRRRADERRRVRQRLVASARARARRRPGRCRLADPRRARPRVPALGTPGGPGRRAGRVPTRAAAAGRCEADGRRDERAAKGDAADEQADVRERVQEPGARARRRADARSLRPQGTPDRRRSDLAGRMRTSSRTRATRPRPMRSH